MEEKIGGGVVGVSCSSQANRFVSNCFWPDDIGVSYVLIDTTYNGEVSITNSEAKSRAEMKTETFLEELNNYVDTYNTENAENTDFIALKNWVFDEETGYPILEKE